MDIVLGVAMLPTAVRILAVEDGDADWVPVEQESFDTPNPPERVAAAILDAQESAAAQGDRLTSTGVAVDDEAQACLLRDALAEHQIENVVLVSTFLAAAALTLVFAGGAAQVALLLVEPARATLAMVNADNLTIADIRRQVLSDDEDEALIELTELAVDAEDADVRPGGLLVVGSGVDVAAFKPKLQAVTSLSVTVPEEPEMALARGAATASVHAPVFMSPVRAEAWSQDCDTEAMSEEAMSEDDAQLDSALLDFRAAPPALARKWLLVGGISLSVVGLAAFTVSLAIGIRPAVDQRSDSGEHVVSNTEPATAPKVSVPSERPAPAPAVQPAPAMPPEEQPPVSAKALVPPAPPRRRPPPGPPPPPVLLIPGLPPIPLPVLPPLPGLPGP